MLAAGQDDDDLETKSFKTLKIDATHYYDNDLVLRQETQKKIARPKS